MWLGSNPQLQHEGKNDTGLNLETCGSVGKRWGDSSRENREALKWRVRKVGDARRYRTLRAQRGKIRRQKRVTVHPEESHKR